MGKQGGQVTRCRVWLIAEEAKEEVSTVTWKKIADLQPKQPQPGRTASKWCRNFVCFNWYSFSCSAILHGGALHGCHSRHITLGSLHEGSAGDKQLQQTQFAGFMFGRKNVGLFSDTLQAYIKGGCWTKTICFRAHWVVNTLYVPVGLWGIAAKHVGGLAAPNALLFVILHTLVSVLHIQRRTSCVIVNYSADASHLFVISFMLLSMLPDLCAGLWHVCQRAAVGHLANYIRP